MIVRPELWVPRTAVELELALADGVFIEDHHHDLKRELPPRDNAGLAVDLASFAVDGGIIIVGVDEDQDTGALTPSPMTLKGIAERVAQVALSRLQPPLVVTVDELPLPSSPERGYAIVRIPASSEAPHQVDGVYRGRGDKTNRALADSDVRRILAERSSRRESIEHLLDHEATRDPLTAVPTGGRLFAVARPVPSMSDRLVAALRNEPEVVIERWLRGEGLAWTNDGTWNTLSRPTRRAGCWSMSAQGIVGVERMLPGDANPLRVLDVEIHEDGDIRLVSGQPVVLDCDGFPFVYESLIADYVLRIVDLAGRLSRELGFFGSWQFGLCVTGLAGARSQAVFRRVGWRAEARAFGGQSYRATTESSAEQAFVAYGQVADRLVARLNRDLNYGRDRELPELERRA